MHPTTLDLRRDDAVLHVTLNRPDRRNAMSLAMVHALRAALRDAEHDGRTRIVVLRGAGGHFCAGADLKDLARAHAGAVAEGEAGAALTDDPGGLSEVSAQFGAMCAAFAATGLATVAVLEGTVMGAGFGLACAADVVVASADVVFRLPETSLGVVPAQIAPFIVERIGYAEARRLAVTGGRVDAAEALALRLVHAVHADAAALDAALGPLLHGLLHNAPGAIAATKALIAKARLQPAASLVHEAALLFSRAALGAEGREGTAAFIARRKPSWAPSPPTSTAADA